MGRSLAGSRVLVLGGSSGIGLAVAQAAATAGAKVTIASRSNGKVEAAVSQIGNGAAGEPLDTTDDAAMEAFFGKHPEWDHIVVSVAAGRSAGIRALTLQDAYDCFYFSADWHVLTDRSDVSDVPQATIEMAADWLGAGLDPERSTLFIQSLVPEHAELHLLFSMVTPVGWLERVPTYKERLRDLAERDISNLGLLAYPVLQTVDITIVEGRYVPVGEDQVSHLEISREIVRRFNRLYGEVLLEPQALLSSTPLIPGSDGRKMSKSLDNTIGVRDGEDAVRATVRSFITDPQKLRKGDPGRPEICPIFALHRKFSPGDVARIEATCRTGELGCVDCKTILADHLVETFAPFRERRAALAASPGVARDVLAAGADKVRPIARETIEIVRDAMHLR